MNPLDTIQQCAACSPWYFGVAVGAWCLHAFAEIWIGARRPKGAGSVPHWLWMAVCAIVLVLVTKLRNRKGIR